VAPYSHPNYRAPSDLPPELRRVAVPIAALAWAERRTGKRVAGVRRLSGASTSAVHRLILADRTSVVLRRYVWPFVLDDDPLTPVREADALVFTATAGLPAPGLIAADVSGAEVGDGVPTLLMVFIPGRPVAVPDPYRLAELAALIHKVNPAGFAYGYSDWFGGALSRPPANAIRPGLWEQAADVVSRGAPPYRTVFIHRDLHPGNVLWRRGQRTGVVDWTNACAGPAGCDIGHCRGNLVRLDGLEAADRFRSAYEAVTGEPYDPYWDLADVFDHGTSPWSGQEISDGENRLGRALAELGHHTVTAPAAGARPPGRPPADWTLATGLVASIVSGQFPELDTSDVRLVGSGWDNEVYLIDNEWAVRFPRRSESVPWLEREIKIMSLVEATAPGQVPHFERVGQPSEQFPHPFVAYRWLPGVAANRVERLDLASLAADLGGVLTRIHQIDTTGLPPTLAGWEEEPWSTNADKLKAVADVLERRLRPDLVHLAGPYLRERMPAPPNRGPRRFVHNDICADHVLIDPRTGRLSGLIDFADAMAGDPVLDFVGLITVGDRPFVAEVLRHYSLPLGETFQVKFDWLARVLTLRWLADALTDDPGDVDQQLTWVERAFNRTHPSGSARAAGGHPI
jgi:aminoglycoside phosphotransferase (APT) family kinase protein